MTDEEKFKYYASKVDTPEKIADLCRKYLEKKNDPILAGMTKTVYIGGDKLVTVNARTSIGMEHLDAYGGPAAAEAMTKRDLSGVLLNEIMAKDLVTWASTRDMCTNSMLYGGKLNIWTGDKR